MYQSEYTEALFRGRKYKQLSCEALRPFSTASKAIVVVTIIYTSVYMIYIIVVGHRHQYTKSVALTRGVLVPKRNRSTLLVSKIN